MNVQEAIALFESNTDFETISNRMLEEGPGIFKFLFISLQKYQNKMSKNAIIITQEEYVRIQRQFYYDLMTILNMEEDDEFKLGFDILNFFFDTYKEDAYRLDMIYRYDLPFVDFDIKVENAFDNVVYILTNLSNKETRTNKLAEVDLNSLLDRNKIRLSSKIIRRIKNYYNN